MFSLLKDKTWFFVYQDMLLIQRFYCLVMNINCWISALWGRIKDRDVTSSENFQNVPGHTIYCMSGRHWNSFDRWITGWPQMKYSAPMTKLRNQSSGLLGNTVTVHGQSKPLSEFHDTAHHTSWVFTGLHYHSQSLSYLKF